MTPCNGACVRLRWQVRRDEQEKQSQPRQPDPSLKRWFLSLLHFLRRGMRLDPRSRTTPSLLRPIAAVPAATASFLFRRCLHYHLAHHLGRHLRFCPGSITTLLLSSKDGLPLSTTEMFFRGRQHRVWRRGDPSDCGRPVCNSRLNHAGAESIRLVMLVPYLNQGAAG